MIRPSLPMRPGEPARHRFRIYQKVLHPSVVATFSMSLSFERTFPSCCGVVPCLIVELTCSSISVVFASPLSSKNFLIFCLSLVVLIFSLFLFWDSTMSAFLRIADGNIMLLYVFSLLGYK